MLSKRYRDTGELDAFDAGLNIVFTIILAFMVLSSCLGQSTCSSPAGPINQNINPPQCYAIQDTSDTLDLCFTFKAPGSILLFASVPPANCNTYSVTAALYDSACNLINPNAFGIVIVQPDASYVWCAKYVCTGSIGYQNLFCPNFSDFSPLPVTWLYFFGRYNKVAGCVLLTWATASEHNSMFFEAQYSTDGQRFWTFDVLPAAGNTSMTSYYKSTDCIPGPISYYRIKQTDFDGSAFYSTTIAVTRDERATQDIQIYDLTGRLVNSIGDMTYLQSGLYLVRVDGNYSKLIIR